jgi:hypothetical protein
MLLSDPENKNRAWIWFTILAVVAAIAWYVIESVSAGRRLGGGSRPGIAFGIVGGAICLFEFFLWPRKKLRRIQQVLPLVAARHWMRAHIWLGLLAIPVLVMHGGVFPWGGSLSTWLMVLFLAVSASGIYGLALQQTLPRRLLEDVPAETVHTQIPFVRAQLRADAERLVWAVCRQAGTGELVVPPPAITVRGKPVPPTPEPVPDPVPDREAPPLKALLAEVAPFLCPDDVYAAYGGKTSTTPRTNPAPSRLGDPRQATLVFADFKLQLKDPRAQGVVETLAGLCERCRQFARQERIQGFLHSWLAIHLPLAVVMVILMVVHAVVAWQYL